ncbi:MAG: ketopantoate reductase family protein [Geodermatophilaceae bacterium]
MTARRLLVVGAGAIGGVTAAKLTRAGHDVVVLDANIEHVACLQSPGLILDEPGRRSTVMIEAVTDPADLTGRFTTALVTVKAVNIEAALRPLVERDLVDTYVSLGNGLVQDRIRQITGAKNLMVGTVEWGATNLGPGHVAQTTSAPFVLGEADGPARPRTRALAELISDVAEVRVTDNIDGQVWSKLLVNSTFSGLGALTGLLYGDVVAEPLGRRLAFAVWTEGFRVAEACGIELDAVLGVHPRDLVVRTAEDLPRAERALAVLMRRVSATKASMLQDLERGAPTEVDVINGGVVTYGRCAGEPTPLNSYIVDLIHDITHGRRQPGRANMAALEARSTKPS